jgi:ArsR family transcriptional regulator
VNELLSVLRAIAEPSRLRLVALCAEGELTVSELAQILGQSQPRVSRHLKQLCDAGVLERLPEGSWAFHRVTRRGVAGDLARQVAAALPADDPQQRRDRERLAEVRRARAMAAGAYFRANAARWNEIRSLHVDEAEVERQLLALLPAERISMLLDVGTGSGRVLQVFAERGVAGVGIDLSHEMLTVARANLARANIADCYVRHGDMYHLPWSERAFDAVTFHQVLHYADEPAAAIGEAARVMKPGGRLVVADFAPHQLERLRTEHSHRRLGFADEEVGAWFAAAGLKLGPTVRLPGRPLTVNLWTGERAA